MKYSPERLSPARLIKNNPQPVTIPIRILPDHTMEGRHTSPSALLTVGMWPRAESISAARWIAGLSSVIVDSAPPPFIQRLSPSRLSPDASQEPEWDPQRAAPYVQNHLFWRETQPVRGQRSEVGVTPAPRVFLNIQSRCWAVPAAERVSIHVHASFFFKNKRKWNNLMKYYTNLRSLGNLTLFPLLVKWWETHLESKPEMRCEEKPHIRFVLDKKDKPANLVSKLGICLS